MLLFSSIVNVKLEASTETLNNISFVVKMSEKELKYVHDQVDRISKEVGFSDYSVDINSGSGAGDGFSGDLLSIKISERNAEKKLHLVCKLIPSNSWGDRSASQVLFYREAFTYNKVLPCFEKFQEEKNVPKEDRFLCYPKCYAAIADYENDIFLLILEDLRLKNFGKWNKAKISPFENVKIVMRELGKFHGFSIAMKDQKPEEFAAFKQINEVNRQLDGNKALDDMFHASYDRVIKALKSENHKKIARDIQNDRKLYSDACVNDESPY